MVSSGGVASRIVYERKIGEIQFRMKQIKPITDKEEKRINEWLKKQAKYQLIRESRNYQRVK
jgi:hypothetical protein